MENLLEGMKVLDLTRVLAGPYASMILADLGAEVIKVELPEKGDESRAFGPFQNGESAYFASVNRGKKSVTIDLRTEAGAQLVRRLAQECDVLIENFRPGSMARFGLDYERIQKENQRLVYASISGFGQTGPYAPRAGYDFLAQGLGGIMSLTGEPDGEPIKVGVGIADVMCGMYAS
ncbi:MAG: CoA transferase, partial [Candidatus Latescibacterota bacterium]|nr:CoA transferase [Candidatus Latescibacterota bacterium]